MRRIERSQGVGTAVNGRFETHLVVGVVQTGPPTQIGFDRLDQGGQSIQRRVHLR